MLLGMYVLMSTHRSQALDITAVLSYSFVVTFLILVLMKFVQLCSGVKAGDSPADGSDPWPDAYEALPQYKRRNMLKGE